MARLASVSYLYHRARRRWEECSKACLCAGHLLRYQAWHHHKRRWTIRLVSWLHFQWALTRRSMVTLAKTHRSFERHVQPCLKGNLRSHKFLYDTNQRVRRAPLVAELSLILLMGVPIYSHIFRAGTIKPSTAIHTRALLQPHVYRTRTVIFLILPQDFLPHASLASLSGPDFIPLVFIITPFSLSL
ncbi:hypothetical protein EV702DRAFT_575622 [Suillus placidus]|uniref:Uncharacterized protein n=1 Tax=Suillus placidus TaxID=48579 RepID=A0A9P6ZNH5_9AGAM|nr:hypothetical protein EV702DRAFT_575622 [Suillus placidus]